MNFAVCVCNCLFVSISSEAWYSKCAKTLVATSVGFLFLSL